MREIKFRAWDKEKKEMCIVDRVTFMFESENGIMAEVVESRNTPSIDEFRRMVMPEHLELMQYTGLKDKNGKEIYEGDVVKSYGFESKDFCIREIRWGTPRYAGFYFYAGDTPTEAMMDLVAEKDIEIIGNIYENPELLSNTKE